MHHMINLKHSISKISIVTILGLSSLASPKIQALEYHPTFNLGFEFGGEKFFEAPLDDGTTRGFNAGSLAILTGGVDVQHTIRDLPLESRIAFGFKGAGAEATNGKYDFFRWILELSEHYRIDKVPLIVGGGLTWHFSNQVIAEGLFAGYSTDVDPSLGFFIQSDYVFRKENGAAFPWSIREYHLGARYTIQSYEKKALDIKINANAVGLHFRLMW